MGLEELLLPDQDMFMAMLHINESGKKQETTTNVEPTNQDI